MKVLVQYHVRPDGRDLRVLGSLTRRTALEVLRRVQAPPGSEVSVLYVDDEEMRSLNRTYRSSDRATDVLAFAMRDGRTLSLPPPECGVGIPLGDVVVSLETARRQARRCGHSLRREIAVLLVHGTLHLLGHDHEPGPSKAAKTARRRMRAAEKDCLARLEENLVL